MRFATTSNRSINISGTGNYVEQESTFVPPGYQPSYATAVTVANDNDANVLIPVPRTVTPSPPGPGGAPPPRGRPLGTG
jgi:hypothetical protein